MCNDLSTCLNCVRTQGTASESYARRLHKMAILCHSLINIKVENLSAFSYLRKRFFIYLCNPFRPEKMAEENLLITYIIIKNSKQYGQNNH